MTLYLHVWNAELDAWDTRNIGIVSESPSIPDGMEDDVRMRIFGSALYKDTPRRAYREALLHEVFKLESGVEICGDGYDRCSLRVDTPAP